MLHAWVAQPGGLKRRRRRRRKNLTYNCGSPGPFQNPDPRNSAATRPAPGSRVPRFPLQSAGHRLPFPGAVPSCCFGSLQSSRAQVAHLTLPRKLGGTWRRGGKDQALSPLSGRGCPAPPDTALAELRRPRAPLRDGPHPARVALLFDRL